VAIFHVLFTKPSPYLSNFQPITRLMGKAIRRRNYPFYFYKRLKLYQKSCKSIDLDCYNNPIVFTRFPDFL